MWMGQKKRKGQEKRKGRKVIKISAFVLSITMCLGLLAGCSDTSQTAGAAAASTSKAAEAAATPGTAGAAAEPETAGADATSKDAGVAETGSTDEETGKSAGARKVVDQLGREVELPANINRVVITSILPIPSVFCLVDGSADKIVGMAPASMGAAQNSLLAAIYPNILKASTEFMKGDTINLEELVKLKPDMIICLAENGEAATLEKTGIPVIAVKTSSVADGNSFETVYSWVELLGKILGKTDKAEYLTKKGYEMLGEVNSKLWVVPEDKKPTALILFNHSSDTIKVSGAHFFGQFWINSAGGKNVAGDLSGTPVVTMEQIYKWNPDYIFITNFTPTQPEDLLDNKVDGQDWSQLKAIKDKKVFKIPLGTYRWFPPSADSPLMIKWIAQMLHPEVFNYYSMEDEAKQYYKEFFGWDLTGEQIYTVFHPSSDAAKGYK